MLKKQTGQERCVVCMAAYCECKREERWPGYVMERSSFESRAVKWADGPRTGPFNRKNFKIRTLVFSVRLNSDFFGPDRISPRSDWTNPRLTGWLGFFFFNFLLIMKNTFNFNTNYNFFTSFLKSFFFFLSILKKLLMNNNIFSISTI